jgi:proton glutamate symport protein
VTGRGPGGLPAGRPQPNIGAMTTTPRLTLSRQIAIGLALGCVVAWLWPSVAVGLEPVSKLFLRLIKMLLGPLLLTTLVAGVAGAGGKLVGRLGVKAIVWFELATTAALLVGLVAANVIQPGAGAHGGDPSKLRDLAKPIVAGDFLVNLVPASIFEALAANQVLQIVVFSVLLGLAVAAAGKAGEPVKAVFEAGAEVMFKLVGFVMRAAPIGVGAAIAVTLGKSGADALIPLVKCIGALYAALIVFLAALLGAMVVLTRAHLPTFLAAIREPAIIALTTSTSDAAMPRAMQALEQLGVPRRIVSFVVPVGYAFNLDGSTLYLSLAVMFVAQAAGVHLGLTEQVSAMLLLMLSSKGVAGVPRAALVVLTGALADLHLPAEGAALLLGIDAIMDMGRTCVNVVGNCVATAVVAAWERELPADAALYWPRAAPRVAPAEL